VLSTFGGLIGVPYALSSIFTDKDVNVIEHTLHPVVATVPAEGRAVAEAHPEEPAAPPPADSHVPPATTEHAPAAAAETHATHSPEEISAERMLAGVSVLIAVLGIGAGWYLFKRRPLLQMPRLLENKYYVDEVYDTTLIRPINVVSREVFWKILDIGVIDGILHSIGDAVTEAGRLARYLQAGFVRGYTAIILFGALILIGLFAFTWAFQVATQ
jgi:NADH-quinone oxidoreductase subunit L